MLNFLKKTNDNIIYAPVKGKCIDISDVNDEVFSKKMMGDGVAIIPIDNIVYSPCEGEIAMVFPTKHAFGITMNNGVEVLIHIGMDTVNLNGLGFKVFKNKGDKVKHGDKIIEFSSNYLSNKDLDMTVMVIITNNNDHKFDKLGIDREVSKEDKILVLEDTE